MGAPQLATGLPWLAMGARAHSVSQKGYELQERQTSMFALSAPMYGFVTRHAWRAHVHAWAVDSGSVSAELGCPGSPVIALR